MIARKSAKLNGMLKKLTKAPLFVKMYCQIVISFFLLAMNRNNKMKLKLSNVRLKEIYYYKRRGIDQYPIFSRIPYFSAKKHTTVVLKLEVLGQKGLFFVTYAAY